MFGVSLFPALVGAGIAPRSLTGSAIGGMVGVGLWILGMLWIGRETLATTPAGIALGLLLAAVIGLAVGGLKRLIFGKRS